VMYYLGGTNAFSLAATFRHFCVRAYLTRR
jgi:hypothetical protein